MRTLILVIACVGVACAASADSISFSAVGENPNTPPGVDLLQASALFEVTATQLIITLTNTGLAAVEVPSELLSGVYFDLANGVVLSPVSAALVSGAQVLQFGLPFVQPVGYELLPDVSTEFAFRDDLPGPDFNGAQFGISANGLDYFGPADRFDTSYPSDVLDAPSSPNGANFGIASAISGTANAGVTDVPVIVGSVQFVFDYTGDLGVNDISNVNFQYGTSLSDPNITIVPEPSTMSLLGIGIAGILAARRLRKKQA